VAYQALAAVLGGCQSLHTNSMDETLALPSEHAVTLALRTQQVLAHETGVTNTVDPLGGSYFVETLTNQMQKEAEEYFEQIKLEGGMIAAIEDGFFRREIAASAFAYQQAVESKQAIIVGVNEFQEREDKPIELLQIDEATERDQIASLRNVKQRRSADDVRRTLESLKRAAGTRQNLMPALIDAAHAKATVGEIMNALADVLGRYRLGGA
jgi:methylmalonyl-CoA mutase N-terminal domain/subunit